MGSRAWGGFFGVAPGPGLKRSVKGNLWKTSIFKGKNLEIVQFESIFGKARIWRDLDLNIFYDFMSIKCGQAATCSVDQSKKRNS